MIKPNCPHCLKKDSSSETRLHVVRAGFFRRRSDSRRVQRFRCLRCLKNFSNATDHPCFKQNKRQFNHRIKRLLSSGVSQRRIAMLLQISRRTVVRKFLFLGGEAQKELDKANRASPLAETVEFDDLETFEHTKLKPLSVTLAVESKTRRILAFEVSKMPAKGTLARLSRKKYGRRADERPKGRAIFFETLKPLVHPQAQFKSDQNPHYPADVKKHFPQAVHERFKGQRGSIVGQGELKKVRFDPLFSLNHTCAMLRANINRLFRKTWCTTKIPHRLQLHIAIYAVFHNLVLLEKN